MKKATNNHRLPMNKVVASRSKFFSLKALYLFIAIFLFMALDGIAQPPPPGGTGPSCWPPPCIPIDGGISWLLVAGVAYGAKKSWDFGKKNQEDEGV